MFSRQLPPIFPTMSFATIYNTLETLIEKGIIQGLGIDPDKKRFDPNPEQIFLFIYRRMKSMVMR
jgi:Fur family peroxide stress response transcriptional regulator